MCEFEYPVHTPYDALLKGDDRRVVFENVESGYYLQYGRAYNIRKKGRCTKII